MNLYGLPEFISYGILVGIAVVLIRQSEGVHLKYWLAGWIIVLLHAAIFMLLNSGFIADVLGRGLLALAGLAFMMAAYYQRSPVLATKAFWQLARVGLPNIGFAVLSTAYVESYPDGSTYGPFALLIAVSAVCVGWQALETAETGRQARVLVGLTVAVYAIQAWCLFTHGVLFASQWLMCWTYLAVAFFFIRQSPALTMGVIFTALSFVLWGLVFPVYSLLQIYAPDTAGHIESLMWNLPKFLTAASMNLVLLEEKVIRATQLATHDDLTGLPNRRLYQDRFNQAIGRANRGKSGFAVLIIDLNRFKQVNDTLGHHVGDLLLRVVSARFRATLREIDTIARTGGDEFTVVLEGVDSVVAAERVIAKLQRAIAEPAILVGKEVDVGASIGPAIYPEDGTTQTELHCVADARMYAEKERSRSGRTLRREELSGVSIAS